MSHATMQALFAAARKDAPDADTRDAMWDGVANATGIAATATTAAAASSAATAAKAAGGSAVTAAALAPKLLVIGALIGVVSAAIGGVVALGWVESETGFGPASTSSANAPIARSVHVPSRGAVLADPRPRARDPVNLDRPTADVNVNVITSRVNGEEVGSGLAEEARIVTEARTALVGGDASRALALLRTTHRFASRALEPEELSLEARALRALGRIDEAAATELTLKARYPSHALAR